MFRTDKMVVHPEWQALLQTHGLDTLSGVYENSAGRRVASSGTTEVREVEFNGIGSAQPRVIFIKRYWFPTFATRRSNARRMWETSSA